MKNIHQHIVLKLKLRKKFNFKLDKVRKHILQFYSCQPPKWLSLVPHWFLTRSHLSLRSFMAKVTDKHSKVYLWELKISSEILKCILFPAQVWNCLNAVFRNWTPLESSRCKMIVLTVEAFSCWRSDTLSGVETSEDYF